MSTQSVSNPFSNWSLNKVELKNRIIKTATFEGLAPAGMPGEKLAKFHERFAEGGSGIVTVAYGAVNNDARTFDDQMCMLDDDVINQLKNVTAGIHKHGAAASIQLAHCGMQTKYSKLSSKYFSKGASYGINAYGLFAGIPFVKPLTESEIEQIVADYATSAQRAVEAGFDIVELHMGHGYLFSQFLCPAVNRRKDKFGGSIENRARFPLMAVRAVREAIGPDVPIIVKLNVKDGFEGGLTLEDSIQVAKMVEADGAASMLVLTGGFSSKNPMYLFRGKSPIKPLIKMQKSFINKLIYTLAARNFPDMPFKEMYFLENAKKIRAEVSMPIALVGGIKSLESFEKTMEEGFDAIVLGRALINQPDLPNLYKNKDTAVSNCISCNRCVAHIDADDGVVCPLLTEELELTA